MQTFSQSLFFDKVGYLKIFLNVNTGFYPYFISFHILRWQAFSSILYEPSLHISLINTECPLRCLLYTIDSHAISQIPDCVQYLYLAYYALVSLPRATKDKQRYLQICPPSLSLSCLVLFSVRYLCRKNTKRFTLYSFNVYSQTTV